MILRGGSQKSIYRFRGRCTGDACKSRPYYNNSTLKDTKDNFMFFEQRNDIINSNIIANVIRKKINKEAW